MKIKMKFLKIGILLNNFKECGIISYGILNAQKIKYKKRGYLSNGKYR